MKALLLIFALAFVVQAQNADLPTYGNIQQITNHRRVYVASDNEDSRARVVTALRKYPALEVVNAPEQAQFFIEYSELSREAVSTVERMNERQQRSQMRVYLFDSDKRKIIVWSDTRSRETEHYLGMKMFDSGRNESELTKRFLKAFKKAQPN